jgi:hypothetical protein
MATTNKAFRVNSGLVVSGGVLYPSAGTTAIAPLVFTSGTNLSSATAGAMEYDGTNFYLTPTAGNRKTVAFLDSNITGSAGSVSNSVLFAATGGAAPSTSFNGSVARTVDYSTVGAAASSHTHGNISNAGAIGSTSGLVVVTGASGVLSALAAGTSGQFLTYNGTWATPTGATYTTSAVTTTGGALLRLTGSDSSTDDVKFASGTNTTVAYTDASTITISSTDTNYYPTAVTMTAGTTAGPTVDLTMSGVSNITGAAIPSASASASGVITTGAQTLAGVKTFSSSPVVPTPTNATDAANKAYVDNAVVGIDWKASVKIATTGALTTSGNIVGSGTSTAYANGTSGVGATLTVSTGAPWSSVLIDGQAISVGDRVLIKDQATALQNGIYTVTQVGTTSNTTSFIFTRATDDDTATENTSGHAVFVETGTTNADSGWVNTTDGTITIGTTLISYTQFTGLGQVTAGTGLTKSGNTLAVDTSTIASLSSTTYVGTTAIALNRASGALSLTGINSVKSPANFGLSLLSGDATGTNADSGGVAIDSGQPTGTGSQGFISVGAGTNSGQLTLGPASNPPGSGQTQVTSLYGSNALYIDNNVAGATIGIASLANGLSTNIQIGRLATATALDVFSSTTFYNGVGFQGATGFSGAITSSGAVTLSGLSSGAGTRFVKMNNSGVLTYDTTAYAPTSGKLSQFAATSSSELAGVISDETGTGALVFAGSPALTGTPTLNAVKGQVATSGSTSGTTALTLSSLYNSATYTGGEFTVKISNGTNIEIVKVLVVTDGTNVYLTTYGDVYIASSIATVDFTYTSTNVNMVVTPVAGTAGTTTVKVSGTLL